MNGATPTDSCPDELVLEAMAAGDESPDLAIDPAVRAHVAGCPACRETLELLASLGRELSAAPPPIAVPAAQDRALRAAAAARAAAIRPRRSRRPALLAVVAAAAAVLALVAVRGVFSGESSRTVAAGDVNGDGRVDVVDALVLARAIDRGGPMPDGCDVDRDGTVDGADVNAIAGMAVSIGPRRGAQERRQ